MPPELRKYPVPLAQKMRMLFESEIDDAGGMFITPVWAVGDLLERGGDFDNFVRARDLVKQEGVLFKRGAYNYACLAHDESDVGEIESAASAAFVALREEIADG